MGANSAEIVWFALMSVNAKRFLLPTGAPSTVTEISRQLALGITLKDCAAPWMTLLVPEGLMVPRALLEALMV